jgi:hypothetical protein
MGDTHRANIARTMGNLGGWSREQYARDVVDHDDDDFASPTDDGPRRSRLARWRGRAICWSLVADVFLAYVNHWPGGH